MNEEVDRVVHGDAEDDRAHERRGVVEGDAGEAQGPEVDRDGQRVRHPRQETHPQRPEVDHHDQADHPAGGQQAQGLAARDAVGRAAQQDGVARGAAGDAFGQLFQAPVDARRQLGEVLRRRGGRAHEDRGGATRRVHQLLELVVCPEEQ